MLLTSITTFLIKFFVSFRKIRILKLILFFFWLPTKLFLLFELQKILITV